MMLGADAADGATRRGSRWWGGGVAAEGSRGIAFMGRRHVSDGEREGRGLSWSAAAHVRGKIVEKG